MLKKHILNIALLYSIVLLVFSLVKISTGNVVPVKNSDKVFHFVAHFLLAIFWFFSFNVKLGIKKSKSFLFAFLFSLIFGIIVETLQHYFTTTREADIKDVIANIMGALLGLLVVKIIRKNE